MIVLKIIGTVIGLLILQMIIENNRKPSNLGVKNGKLAGMPKSPNAVSSQTDILDKKVDSIPFKGDLKDSKEFVKKALDSYGDIKIVLEEENYIYAVSTTSKMKYHDDIELYFDEENKIIDFRSASRVGYSDRGLNRERYNKLFK